MRVIPCRQKYQEAVVNFVAEIAPRFNNFQQHATRGHKRFNKFQLRTRKFRTVQ